MRGAGAGIQIVRPRSSPKTNDDWPRQSSAGQAERPSPLERNLLYRFDGLGGTAPALEVQLL